MFPLPLFSFPLHSTPTCNCNPQDTPKPEQIDTQPTKTMKRRISETAPEDPSPIRTLPPLRNLHGVRSSDSRFPNPTSRRPKDFSCKKRMQLTDAGVVSPVRMLKASRSDDPKTSEFAFFKKLKGNAGHKLHSHRDDNQSKKFQVSGCSGERTNSVKNSFKDFRSSLVTQNITPINFRSSLSPLSGASKNTGAQHMHGEIFSKKRQKLRQRVVETSYPHIEELCSKGCDFVSLLLNRLFPEDNENSAFKNSKPGEVDIDTKSQSLASLEADVQLKKLGHIPARNSMELDYCSHLDDGPSCWLNRSQELVPSNSYSPISDVLTCLKYEIREPGYEFGGRTPVICADSDSAYGFPSKRYGSFACNHLKELDEVHDPNELFIWQAFKNSKPGEVDIDTKSQSLASLESDVQLKKLGYIPARNSMELDYGSLLDDSPSSCWLNRSQEAVLSNSYSPVGDAIAYLKYEIREPGYQFGGRTPFLYADSDSAYGFPSKRYGSFACNHLKELDEVHDPNELFIWQAFKNSKPGEVDIDTKSQSLASLESDVQLKKLGYIPARNSMKLDYGSHLDDSPSSCWLNRSQEAVLSNSYSPIGDAIAYLKYETREPGYQLGGRTPFLCADTDSAYGFPSKRYGSFACNHLKELGELHDPNEYSIQREQHALLLGWDFDEGIDKRNLSNTCKNTELSVYSPSSSSWGDDHQHIMNDRFGENEFSKSSFLSICSPKVIPLPRSQSLLASYTDHDFGRHVIGDEEDIYTDVNHFPLALSLTPDYLNLAEDCKNDTECKDNSIFRAPQNLHHIMSKVFSKTYHCPGIEGSLFSSALGLTGSSREHYSPFNYALQTPRNEGTSSRFLLKDKNESCLDGLSHRETPSHFGEDIINILDCSSFYFQIPLDKEKACPLLLNQSSWDGN
ncbi:uncharacterized protein LOC132164922 isoform X2 [Corylus avellana]|uniref:uncharacterized protein LOC132164922 isoform X2 n=1 Tax=Corylus avellana TaxID=13451 RepID=UPI00286C92F6|nr:uncharacterized protein LOC132164922 isoform X2 [Corylus avellana]